MNTAIRFKKQKCVKRTSNQLRRIYTNLTNDNFLTKSRSKKDTRKITT